MTGTLRVRNIAQKILFTQELSGQLSDGHWENSSPRDHWQPWCSAKVVVDPTHPGRDFYARRDTYDFAAKQLLDVVADRMIEAVRLATGDASYDLKALRADLKDLKAIIKVRVPEATPVPTQPRTYKAKLIVDGYAQEFTAYYPRQDDPRAVEQLRKRDREQAEYRLKRLVKEHAEAKAKADKLSAELDALRTELEAQKDADAEATLRALAEVRV